MRPGAVDRLFHRFNRKKHPNAEANQKPKLLIVCMEKIAQIVQRHVTPSSASAFRRATGEGSTGRRLETAPFVIPSATTPSMTGWCSE